MTLEEINEGIELCNRRLTGYTIQMESLCSKEDIMSEEVQAQVECLIKEIQNTAQELENLINQI